MVTARVLRWHGGKGKLAARLAAMLPEHSVYTEVYGGSAAVLLEKAPAKFEAYNDLNGDLVNFFRVLRDHPEELIRGVELTPYAREEYGAAGEPSDDPIERARRFIVASWMTVAGFEGQFRSVTDWRRLLRSERPNPPSKQWAAIGNRLWAAAQRLRAVQIDHKPALEALRDYDAPNACHYLDPPYPVATRSGPKRYAVEMTDGDHAQLLDAVNQLEGAVVISSYRNELYDSKLKGFTRHDITVPLQSTMAGRGQKRTERVECVWIRSPRPHQQSTLLEVAT